MKRPQNIDVGNRNYKIVIDPALQLEEGLTGLCNHNKQKISILPLFLSCQLDETLWHEVSHTINTVFLHSKLCEDEIHAFGHGLSQAVLSMGISFDWEEGAIIKGGV